MSSSASRSHLKRALGSCSDFPEHAPRGLSIVLEYRACQEGFRAASQGQSAFGQRLVGVFCSDFMMLDSWQGETSLVESVL